MNSLEVSVAVSFDKGKRRKNNEDNFFLDGLFLTEKTRETAATYRAKLQKELGIFGVFDGMGGEARGELASFVAASACYRVQNKLLADQSADLREEILKEIDQANQRICSKMLDLGESRIGTTVAMVAVCKDVAEIFNVGDSRVYLLRDGQRKQISTDDTGAQQMIKLGILTEEEAKHHRERHKLTQHLGIFPEEMIVEPHVVEIELHPEDKLLLCSDGLTDMVADNEILAILNDGSDAAVLSQKLVEQALEHGGFDNVTAMVLCVEEKIK